MSVAYPGGRRTEEERAVLYERPERFSARLKAGYKRRLRSLATESGTSVASLIESMVDDLWLWRGKDRK